jgi:hypothetical protein
MKTLLTIMYIFVVINMYSASKTIYTRINPSSFSTNTNWSNTIGGVSCGCTPDPSKDIIYILHNTASPSFSLGNGATL